MDIDNFLKVRLDEMFHTPKMWGGLEALELQALLILELRLRVNVISKNIMDEYVRFLPTVLPKIGNNPASCKVKNHEELVIILRKFTDYLDIDH